MTYKRGIIEGFYGKPWSFEARRAYVPFMQAHAYDFFIYAPKADTWLREAWQSETPEPLAKKLTSLGEDFRAAGIDWGVGLSPFELHQQFNSEARTQLKQKLKQLSGWHCNTLAILFDDMRGSFPQLAQTQIDICHFVCEHSDFEHVLMCPSYYSFDPVLEKVFDQMPEQYWQTLGKGLHRDIDIFWTGEQVCSPAYSEVHLLEVRELFQRKPFIWDNYPVNDGARMSPFLHVSPFQGREHCHADCVAGMAVNPMNQAYLSQWPLASLSAHINGQDVDAVWKNFAEQHFGSAASVLLEDVPLFETQGLHEIDEVHRQALLNKYQRLKNTTNQVYLDELCAYLRGDYLFDIHKNQVPTQSLWQDT